MLEPYTAEIAALAGFRPDHPGLSQAIRYAEAVLTSRLGPLQDREATYTLVLDSPREVVPIPRGEVVEGPPGALLGPGYYRLENPQPGQALTFRVVKRLSPESNPAVLRAAAELAQAFLMVPEPGRATPTFSPTLALLEKEYGPGVGGVA